MRSLFYAMGYTEEELAQPLIGVVSAHSEIVPGHMHLDKITEAVKAGVRMAGGTPIMVPAIGVCDGIAMGHIGMKYSLPSRELIADSVESMAQAHQFDGLVLVPNCDKIVPGMLMGALRLDIPAVVCSGGPMMSGLVGGEETSLSKMFEAVGARKAGIIDDPEDIFMLGYEDVRCAGVDPNYPAREIVAKNRAEMEEAKNRAPREWYGTATQWQVYEEPYKTLWGYPQRFEAEQAEAGRPAEVPRERHPPGSGPPEGS